MCPPNPSDGRLDVSLQTTMWTRCWWGGGGHQRIRLGVISVYRPWETPVGAHGDMLLERKGNRSPAGGSEREAWMSEPLGWSGVTRVTFHPLEPKRSTQRAG